MYCFHFLKRSVLSSNVWLYLLALHKLKANLEKLQRGGHYFTVPFKVRVRDPLLVVKQLCAAIGLTFIIYDIYYF